MHPAPLPPIPHRPARVALWLVTLTAVVALIAGACGDDGDTTTSATTRSATTTSTTTTTTTTAAAPTGGTPDLAGLESWISCGDAVVFFATPDDTTVLRVTVPDLLARAEDTGGPLDLEFDIATPDSAASVTLEQGIGLRTTVCNDVPDPDYEVTDTWTADAGTVRLTVDEVPEGPLEECATSLEVALAIENVTIPIDGESLAVPDLDHTGLVGWCPG